MTADVSLRSIHRMFGDFQQPLAMFRAVMQRAFAIDIDDVCVLQVLDNVCVFRTEAGTEIT